MAIANSLSGFLQVYAYKSLPAFLADLPPRDLFVENFDDSIANEGTAVVTRIPTTVFGGSLNNLDAGWANQSATASAVTVTLGTKGLDHTFNVTQWATIGEQQLLNTFANVLAKQVANGIAVSIMNNVTNSVYTNSVTVASSSLFTFTGSNSLQAISTTLDNLEIPQSERYAILTPNAYQSLIGSQGVYQQYVYGDPTIIRYNGFKDADGKALNSSNPGMYLAGFNTFKYARLNANTAKTPYGGATVSTNGGIIGFAGNKAGLAFAARTPVTINNPLVQTYTVVDPTSGFPLQFILAFDPSLPGWRVGVYSLFGSAQGNTNAIVPILATSGV